MRPSETEVYILKCLEIMPEIIFSEEFLLLDHKRLVPELLGYSDDPFRRIMQYYDILKGDFGKGLESRVVAKEVFRQYGWNFQCCDEINPFYPVFARDLVAYSSLNPGLNRTIYKSFSEETRNSKCMLYKQGETGELKIYTNGRMQECSRRMLAREYLEKNSLQSFIIDEYYFKEKEHANRKELAGLCHCTANFMPCLPPVGDELLFSEVKSTLPDVKDFFNLMVDKIQLCIRRNMELICTVDGKKKIVDIVLLQKWHEWLVLHREEYCLEDYYFVIEKDGKKEICGIPLFEGQALGHALPDKQDARGMNQCVREMIQRIRARAERMHVAKKSSFLLS